jgi:prepilin-type N-terminal cleavage/methylation domain-containing protein
MEKRGFTLVELAIVLVIIGLVSAGVLIGRDLVHGAALRADIAQAEKLNVAVNAFRGKYNCLPGDCASASQLVPGSQDGNGNGRIVNNDGLNGNPDMESAVLYHYNSEPAFLMDHLARAGLISSPAFDPNDPVAALAVGQGLMALPSANGSGIAAQCVIDDIAYSNMGCHYLLLGVSKDDNADALSTQRPPYSGADAQSIDSKIDDGRPLTGTVVGLSPMPFDDALTAPAMPYGSAIETRCALDPNGVYSDDTHYNHASNSKTCALRVKASF